MIKAVYFENATRFNLKKCILAEQKFMTDLQTSSPARGLAGAAVARAPLLPRPVPHSCLEGK